MLEGVGAIFGAELNAITDRYEHNVDQLVVLLPLKA